MSVGPRGPKDKVTLSRASLHPYQELRQLNDYLFNFFKIYIKHASFLFTRNLQVAIPIKHFLKDGLIYKVVQNLNVHILYKNNHLQHMICPIPSDINLVNEIS